MRQDTQWQVSPDEHDEALRAAESSLTELALRLDRPVPSALFPTVALALGKRARTLFVGYIRLAESDVPAAAVALLRPMIEINLVLRFLIADPELHTEIWIAEGERQAAILVRGVESDAELLSRRGPIPLPNGWHEDKQRYIEHVRKRARAAGVAGVSSAKGGPVMPSIGVVAEKHGDLASREAYKLAYRGLNPAIHSSSYAFQRARFETEAGYVAITELDNPDALRGDRALNATTFASTLCILSGPLELETFDEANVIKDVLVRLGLDEEQLGS